MGRLGGENRISMPTNNSNLSSGKSKILGVLGILFGGLGAALVVFILTKYFEPNPGRAWTLNAALDKQCSGKATPEEISRCAATVVMRIERAETSIREIATYEDIPKELVENIREKIDDQDVEAALNEIEDVAKKYDRTLFAHWTDEDNDCQNTRHEILIASSQIAPVLTSNGCQVKEGLWLDPYTGMEATEAKKLDIDHIVPLKEAWVSGAYSWTNEKRKQFANDPSNVVATSKSANRRKGAKDPSQWLPPDAAYICENLRNWSLIKISWGLSADKPESRAIQEAAREHCS